MEHPFINNLSTKSLEELQDAITGLMSKINFAQRTLNQPLLNQLYMALESYKKEYGKRMDEMISKQNIQPKINIENER